MFHKPMSEEELNCENLVSQTTRRDKSGRFIVTFPIKGSLDFLGESQSLSIKRFVSDYNKI